MFQRPGIMRTKAPKLACLTDWAGNLHIAAIHFLLPTTGPK